MGGPFRFLAVVVSRIARTKDSLAGPDNPSGSCHLLLVFLTAVVGSQVAPLQAAEPLKPNIVYILADDLGYGDVGCYHSDCKIPTPHIDRLAVEGMRFTDAHAPASVCTPTRYALLTGRYAWRTRLQRNVIGPFSQPLIAAKRLTVAGLLREQGYATYPCEHADFLLL